MSYRATRTKKVLGCSHFLPGELGVLTSSGVSNHKSEKVGTAFCLGELIWLFISQFGSRYQKLPLILVAWTSLASAAYWITGKSRLAPKHMQENWVAMCVSLHLECKGFHDFLEILACELKEATWWDKKDNWTGLGSNQDSATYQLCDFDHKY